ncbi:FAD-containing monooxygenase [Lecanosticta acicola]|uniref:FAD-containing monooxygenase n=1 Tax=Lecanosticta acicola TaxID=111012 RepID=A0AAI8YYX4_9PEZI|nr:FAD-containing monooxygenase [Lecanosticta acicola]
MAWFPEKGDDSYDVIVIGAGISGVNFGYRLQERCPNLTYTILEGRHELGGTWSLFKYPGIRSDSDLYTFGFPWRPWRENTAIAQGDLIKKYLNDSAEMYGIDKKIQYNTKVSDAAYDTTQKSWTLQAKVNGTQDKTFRARFILMCTGYYDYETPLETNIPGIDNFQGQVIHPQFWPEDLDYSDKDVVVIGSGATAITVLPVMAEKARRVTMLQRSPSYVMAVPGQDAVERFIKTWLRWAPGLQDFLMRLKWIMSPLLLTSLSARYPEKMKQFMYKVTQKQLPASIPRDPHFTPSYFPWEQRMCMCPDGDFFRSLRSGKSNVETGVIENITQDTIKLTDGKELHPDIIITATGLKLRFAGGMNVSVDGQAYAPSEKFVWKGVMLEDLPNAAFVVGYVDASWTLGADATAQTMTRMFNQMRKEGVVEVTPHRNEREKREMKETNLLRLNSTYVTKGKSVLPKGGDRGQWVPRSNYLRDIFMAWYGDIKTGTEWVRGV